MIIVFTGEGKGKTTAALGQMVRVLGRGRRALMIQFIKGPWKSGEDDFASRFNIPQNEWCIRKCGKGFVGILGDTLPREEHIKAAEEALAMFAKELKKDNWDLIVLDEVNVALSLHLIQEKNLLSLLEKVKYDKLVILTGRGATSNIIQKADLVTEMKEIKHPFREGKLGEKLIEF